ncbi:NADPH-dependent 7-cyano-7-deazaguanine reductase QueF [Criblamydia sequanensis]|uniref:NADPH-dependent 7-cyano-7-deazaguanine reductase n=1 Tax=Candidatus Criblamydia sequanensis CRIB-18 TaxID=1437425 RepID=A0A090D2H0_9BACT|nr:NADPH-dependent 7-cyano-7-deazaguanine reductase QueF [Criblamydia sequanensis]CDR34640.1 NADPH-dependent 7-cyano-7-deazaguanine reductase [Criblamydia sequanensis CRIB-18]
MLDLAPLGKKTVYIETYSPELLFPVSRNLARDKLKLDSIPFKGWDKWNGYEISFLNRKGKPLIALAEFTFPCTTENIVESKSLKLYLNSFNASAFDSLEEVQEIMEKDISSAIKGEVSVKLFPLTSLKEKELRELPGTCIDDLDIEVNEYSVNPKLLKTSSAEVEETLYSNLLKSNCLATGQPDWGSLWIHYAGPRIDHESLLKYIISFRNHSGFAEHCVESIFMDLFKECRPKNLSVYARYTRRGGLDINPFRSNFEDLFINERNIRQ